MLHVPSVTRHLSRSSRQVARNSLIKFGTPHRHLLTLAIETSCDDTCVAILEHDPHGSSSHDRRQAAPVDGQGSSPKSQPCTKLYFDEKITSKNTGLGGIHPIHALNSHRSHLAKLINKALLSLPLSDHDGADGSNHIVCRDGSLRQKPDFVSVTRGPGMRSNLSSGLETAKGLAVAWQVPMVGVHHMQAHTLTPRFINAMDNTNAKPYEPEFPFLTLLVSGGHTMLLYSTSLVEHKILATEDDVAIGDALDKSGRLLLPDDVKANAPDTSFGKYLSQYAFPDPESFDSWPIPKRRGDELDKAANEFGWQIQVPMSETRELKFSFSGLASRVESILKERERMLRTPLPPDERLLLAQTAIGTSFEHLGSRTLIALEMLNKQNIVIRNLVVSGGVAANDFLRYYLRKLLDIRGFEDVTLIFPPVEYCTDNAAMIAWAGMEMYQAGYTSDLSIDSERRWSMDAEAEDGGILGLDGWHRNV